MAVLGNRRSNAISPNPSPVLIGARDLTDPQRRALRASGIRWLPTASARNVEALTTALDDLANRIDMVHQHVDLDVYDPSIAPANGYAAEDGLTAEDVKRVVRLTAERLPVVAATLASYDPSYDSQCRLRDVALELLVHLGAILSRS